MNTEKIRLQKFLAQCGISSRRKAEEYIREGKVRVNGQVVTQMGVKVSPGDRVEVDGKPVKMEKTRFIYFCISQRVMLQRQAILKAARQCSTWFRM